MSQLPPDVHADLQTLLLGLSASDNDIRTRAEDQLNKDWVLTRPPILLMGLVEQLRDTKEPAVRLFPHCYRI